MNYSLIHDVIGLLLYPTNSITIFPSSVFPTLLSLVSCHLRRRKRRSTFSSDSYTTYGVPVPRKPGAPVPRKPSFSLYLSILFYILKLFILWSDRNLMLLGHSQSNFGSNDVSLMCVRPSV